MSNLFFDEHEAIEELQRRGYRVIKEHFPTANSVSTVKDLTNYFYSRRRFYNEERKFPISIDYSEDIKAISSFVKSRQKLGLGRKAAVAEAAVIIDALFKFEPHLRLKEPILSPNILAVRPIIDRVCAFLNGEVDEVSETEAFLYGDEWNEYYNKRYAEEDFQKAARMRERILERIDECKNR